MTTALATEAVWAQTAKQKLACTPAAIKKASVLELAQDLRSLKSWAGDIGLSEDEAECERQKLEALEARVKAPAPSDSKLDRAEALQFLGRGAEAVGLYREWIQTNPNSLLAQFRLGEYWSEKKDPAQQRKHFLAVVRLEPRGVEEQSLWFAALERLLPSVDPKEALPLVRRAVGRAADPKPWVVRMGDFAVQAKNAESLRWALSQMSGPMALLFRAELLYLEDKFSEAARNFWQYLRTDGADPSRRRHVQAQLLKIFEKDRDWPRIRRISDEILTVDPSDAEALRLQELSILKGALNQKNRMRDLERAIDLNPKSAALQIMKINVLLGGPLRPSRRGTLNEDRLIQADAHIEVLLSQDRASVEANYWKAVSLFHRSSFTTADRFFAQALESLRTGLRATTVDSVDAWIGAALNKRARGYFSEGRELLAEAMTRTQDKAKKDEIRKLLAEWGRDT